MSNDIKNVVDEVTKGYALSLNGIHGVAHWARVMENGFRLCVETKADHDVVALFAVLHDSRRVNEGSDIEHGMRAATLASQLRGVAYKLNHDQFALLLIACEGHTTHATHRNITVQTCWDADRLDLGRVGITPDPERLCTKAAKRQSMIDWAHERAVSQFVPGFAGEHWIVKN